MRFDAQAHVPTGTVIWEGFMVPLRDIAAEMSGGAVEVDIQPVGAIAPHELADAVADGRCCSAESSMLDTENIPEAAVATSPPFSYTDVRQIMDFWYNYRGGEAIQMLEAAYEKQGLKLITLIPFCGTYGAMTKFPVSGVDDFAGKTFRSIGTYAQMVRAMGGTPVNIRLADVYEALETDKIQGVVMDLSGLVDFGWKDLIKYVMLPPIVPSSPTTYIYNLDKWNAMSAQAREVISGAARKAVNTSLFEYSRGIEQRAFDAISGSGIQKVTLSGEAFDRYKAIGDPIWDAIEAKSDNNRHLVAMLREYLRTV